MSDSGVDFLLGILGAEGSPARSIAEQRLRGGESPDWDWLKPQLVAHELVPRLGRWQAGVHAVPESLRTELVGVAKAARLRAKRSQFTLYRFLRAAGERQLRTVVLKGSALVHRVYDDPAERHMIDVDLLVPHDQVKLACDIGRSVGLDLGARKLPEWFLRMVHFEILLEPTLDGLVGVDLHWLLHTPAQLWTDRVEDLWARAEPIELWGLPTRVLHPTHQWLHLVTHFWTNWGFTPDQLGDEVLPGLMRDTTGTVHPKWLMDLVAGTEWLAVQVDAEEVREEAAAWSADREVAATARLMAPLLSARAGAFLAQVGGPGTAEPGRAGAPLPTASAHEAVGFRLRSLRMFGQWLMPPSKYLKTLGVSRLQHVATVVGRATAAALALPAALVSRRSRRARPVESRAERVFALVAEMRAFEQAAECEPQREGVAGE